MQFSWQYSGSEYFLIHFKRVKGIYVYATVSFHICTTAGSWLSPRAEALYITHYEMRMWTSWWNCTNLHLFLPVWENKQHVSFLSPHSRKLSPASASTLPSHPSKSSVLGHWPAEEPSPRTPCSSPREPKHPSRWQGACGVTAHTQKCVHLYKHYGIWPHRAP